MANFPGANGLIIGLVRGLEGAGGGGGYYNGPCRSSVLTIFEGHQATRWVRWSNINVVLGERGKVTTNWSFFSKKARS